MISVDEALEIVLEHSQPLGTERVPLVDCLDRFLAEDVVARDLIPAGPTSAMDGWAVRAADVTGSGAGLRVVGEIPAGTVPPRPLAPGESMKIFTGSLLPEGADAVVMVEVSRVEEGCVRFEEPVSPGQHVRLAGEVVRPGDRVLGGGIRVGPGHVSLLGSLGYAKPLVSRRPRVSVLPTGSELVSVASALSLGQVRESNSLALAAQVRRTGGIPRLFEPARDDSAVLRAAVEAAISDADVLITSGGVSMGDYDLVGDVLEKLGFQTHFTAIRVKPGKPVTFATRGEQQVFGLPGNPVSSMVSFELFARPALRRRMSARDLARTQARVVLDEPLSKHHGRREYQRVFLEDRDGVLHARLTGPQGSGIMTSMAAAQALAILPEETREIPAGECTRVVLLDECLERVTA